MPTASGYVWLITGANRGIGLEMTKQLLQQPYNTIVATTRDPAKATALHGLKGSAKGTLHVVSLEVTDRESVRKCAAEVAGIVGDHGIDYLVNNAGILISEGHKDTGYTMDIDILERVLKTNVSAPAYISQVFLPLVEKSEKKAVVNISSTMGSKTVGGTLERAASYSISKAALNMLTCKQARERPDITAVSICPGWLQTDMGGEGAMHPVSVGVAGVIKVVTGLTPANSGDFINFEGQRVAW
ncbi:C-factor [Daedaleopsis nitida]|nr:C-factor [Daedaleopsis nitida]